MEQQANDYRQKCGLTEEFFCKYNPTQEFILRFRQQKDTDYVLPCCEPVADRDAVKAERKRLLEKLNRIGTRIQSFQELLSKFLNETSNKRANLIAALTQNDPEMLQHLNQMEELIVKIEVDIHKCMYPRFSENFNSVEQLSSSVCEPLDVIVEEIEKAFYSRMYAIEKAFAVAEAQAQESGFFAKAARYLLSGIKSVFETTKKFVSTIRAASYFLWVYNQPALNEFIRLEPEKTLVFNGQLCKLTTDNAFFNFYHLAYNTIVSSVENNKQLFVLLRNKFRAFCNKTENHLLTYMQTTAGSILDIDEKQTTKPTSYDFIETTLKKVLDDLKAVDFCNAVVVFNEDRFTRQRVADIMWLLCITSIITFRGLVEYIGKKSFTDSCKAKFVDREVDKEKQVQENTSDEKNRTIFFGDSGRLVPEGKTDEQERAENQEIYIEDSKNKADKANFPDLSKLFLVPEKELPFLVKAFMQDVWNQNKVDNNNKLIGTVIDVAFKFFWFFADHNFIPTTDVEEDLPEKFKSVNWGAELPEIMKKVPDYVRFAYCQAQNNTAEECTELVSSNTPIAALADSEQRYHDYLQRAQMEYESLQSRDRERVLQSDETVQTEIEEALAKVQRQYPGRLELKTSEFIIPPQMPTTQATTQPTTTRPPTQPTTRPPTQPTTQPISRQTTQPTKVAVQSGVQSKLQAGKLPTRKPKV